MLLLMCEKLTWKKAEVTNWYHWGRQSCSQSQKPWSKPECRFERAGSGLYAQWGALRATSGVHAQLLCGLLLMCLW